MSLLSRNPTKLTTAPQERPVRSRGWLFGGGVAIVALVLAGWFANEAVNTSIHDNVQQRVGRAVSEGMQVALSEAPLRYVGADQGNYYVPDIFRSQTMTLCVATAAWDDALQDLNQDQSRAACQLESPSIWPGPGMDAADVVVTVRYTGWLGRGRSDIFTVPVTLPHYTTAHKTAGFPGPVECSGS